MSHRPSRRSALKFLGLGGITSAIAPSVLLQACKSAVDNENSSGFAYGTLNATQAKTLGLLQDVLLPRTDTPSATDVGSVAFMDAWLTYGYKAEDRARFLYRLDKFGALLKADESIEVADLDAASAEAMLKRYYVDYTAPAADDKTMEIEGNTVERKEQDAADGDAATAVVYEADAVEVNALLKGLRGVTLESYFQSEQIGLEVLNYDPIPGAFVGQLPMSDVPNGRAWSL